MLYWFLKFTSNGLLMSFSAKHPFCFSHHAPLSLTFKFFLELSVVLTRKPFWLFKRKNASQKLEHHRHVMGKVYLFLLSFSSHSPFFHFLSFSLLFRGWHGLHGILSPSSAPDSGNIQWSHQFLVKGQEIGSWDVRNIRLPNHLKKNYPTEILLKNPIDRKCYLIRVKPTCLYFQSTNPIWNSKFAQVISRQL